MKIEMSDKSSIKNVRMDVQESADHLFCFNLAMI